MYQYDLAVRGDRDGLWDWNLASNRVHFSPRWVSMVGCQDHEVGDSPDEWLKRIHPDDRERVRGEIDAVRTDTATGFEIEHRILHGNGTYRWMSCRGVVVRDESGQAIRMIGSHSDVTADKVVDALTGLPNRLLFLDRLVRSIAYVRRHPDFRYAVLLLDVDRSDLLEESPRPRTGDPLLTAVARRLESCLRGGEPSACLGHDYVVARLRGGQFGILIDGLNRAGEAQVAADRVLAALAAPLPLSGHDVYLHAGVGVAVSETGYTSPDDVLRDADAALYRAKSLGESRCEVFDTAILQSSQARLQLETDLERALERRELVLHYQPILSLPSNQVAGFEALVRWQHPLQGLIPPLEFIPIAEQTGLIVQIGRWVLREACLQLKAWQESVPAAKDLWVSVNVSSPQFKQSTLVEQVAEALAEVALEPQCLMLELTEGVVMENPAAIKGVIMQLRALGVRIGLDDFGTGHSSLAYLHQFPADFLKIDRSFVRSIEVRQDMADIVSAVADLAGHLRLQVIAEGIETEEQLALVRSLPCEFAQGFLFSRPVDSHAAAQLLRTGLTREAASTPDTESPRGPRPGGLLTGIGKGGGRLRKSVALYVVLAAAAVVLSASFAAHRAVGPTPTLRPAAPRAVESPRPTVASPASPDTSRRQGSRATATPARPAPTPIDVGPPRPASLSFPVVHQHVLGSCRGNLQVSRSGISFVPDKGNDAFTLEYHQFLAGLSGDGLTIRSETKTYRFKSADAVDVDENRARLQNVVDAVALFRQD
jgi:diguanylate cyclase (GGDEF)-like protein/PAS domain S-box-containing protein